MPTNKSTRFAGETRAKLEFLRHRPTFSNVLKLFWDELGCLKSTDPMATTLRLRVHDEMIKKSRIEVQGD